MGLDYYFYVQQRDGDSWIAGPEFDTEVNDPRDTHHAPRGHLTWFDDKAVTIHRLFVGADAIFPLNREPLTDLTVQAFFSGGPLAPDVTPESVVTWKTNALAERFVGWINRDDLLIDCWRKQELIIRKHVPIEIARFFKHGDRRFPRTQLLDLGWERHVVDDLSRTYGYSYDRTFDPHGYSLIDSPIRWQDSELDSSDLDNTVPVSWRSTLADFVGETTMKRFERLLAIPADVRIICLLH